MAIEIRLPLSGSCWETVLELCGSCALSYNGLHYTRHYTRGKRGYLRLRYFDFFPGRNPVTPISRRFLVGRLVSKLLVASVGLITARGATSSTVNPSGKFGT